MTGAATLNVSANVATVTLVSESRLNAIDIAMARDLVRLAQQLVTRDDIRCVLLRGAGSRAFCAGIDLKAVDATGDRAGAFAELDHHLIETERHFRSIGAPSVSLLRGACMGGGVLLSTMTDFRIGSTSLKYAVPAMAHGLIYPIEGLQSLAAIAGAQRAKHIVFDGRPLAPSVLLQWGILDEMHMDADLDSAAASFTQHLASRSQALSSIYKELFKHIGTGDIAAAHHIRSQALRKDP